jgi:hypothetical protein
MTCTHCGASDVAHCQQEDCAWLAEMVEQVPEQKRRTSQGQVIGPFGDRIDALLVGGKAAEARHMLTDAGWLCSEATTYIRLRANTLGVVL